MLPCCVRSVTLTLPLTEALASGMVDVPAYFTTMRDESDGASSQGLSPAQLQDLLVANFAPWNSPQLVPTIMNMVGRCVCGLGGRGGDGSVVVEREGGRVEGDRSRAVCCMPMFGPWAGGGVGSAGPGGA